MDHSERMHRCISGQTIDRVPVALWRHFPVEDQDLGLLAKAVVRFQETYDFDFVKITPASSFCVKDWGVKDEWRGNPEGTREIIKYPIQEPEDWHKIKSQSITKGSMSAQIECIHLVKSDLPPNTPIIQTIFSPLAQAKNLVGRNNLVTHLRLYPDEVKQALQVITETTSNFVKQVALTGIDGVFFAVQHAQAGLLSSEEFDEFVQPYDLEVLSYCHDFWLNLAHIHGENIYFDKISNYPVQILNWHDQQTPPDLNLSKSKFPGIVCGGLKQWETLVNGSPELVSKEAKHAIEATQSERFILGTGCVLPITAPHSNILAVRESVEKAKS